MNQPAIDLDTLLERLLAGDSYGDVTYEELEVLNGFMSDPAVSKSRFLEDSPELAHLREIHRWQKDLYANTPDPRIKWTPAVFLDRAQEIKHRLSVWHIHDPTMPIWAPNFIEGQEAIRMLFRAFILRGRHGPRPSGGFHIFPGLVKKEDRDKGYGGTALENPVSPIDKSYTQWLLRDFHEHLPDAGSTETAKYLQLAFNRILDSPAYVHRPPSCEAERHLLRRKNTEDPQAGCCLIGGREIDPELLDGLISAAERFFQATPQKAEGDPNSADLEEDVWHAPGFRSVNWFGKSYTFTENQAKIVEVLWRCWLRRASSVGAKTLLDAVDPAVPPTRINNVFRDSDAWGEMIVSGARKGTYQLYPPRKTPENPIE